MGPKKNQQKMSLGDFLQDKTLGSWADEMEDLPTVPSTGGDARNSGYGARRDDYGEHKNSFNSYSRDSHGGGFGGGDRDGYAPRTQLPIPDKGPFTAHIGNLSFDASEGDLEAFFADCEVSNIRLVRDKMDDRPKGFGYIEFHTREGLIKALDLAGRSLAGREVRVNVAEPQKDRPDNSALFATEWKRGGPLPPLERESSNFRREGNRGFGGGDRGFGGGSEAGDRPERPERRGTGFQDDGRVRDFGNWERKGPLPTAAPTSVERPQSRDRASMRQQSPANAEGAHPPRRPFVERAPTAAEKDNEWRRGARPEAPTSPAKSSGPASPVMAHVRPKLELKKRSENAAAALASPSADSKASPFGAARPIDTSAKLREIEEKIARERKEKEEKLKEERERRAKAAAEEKEKTPVRARNFDLLRRGSNAPSDAGHEEEAPKSSATSQAGEKPPAPEPAAAVASPVAAEPAAPAAQAEDGWETVVKVPKRGRGANGKQIVS